MKSMFRKRKRKAQRDASLRDVGAATNAAATSSSSSTLVASRVASAAGGALDEERAVIVSSKGDNAGSSRRVHKKQRRGEAGSRATAGAGLAFQSDAAAAAHAKSLLNQSVSSRKSAQCNISMNEFAQGATVDVDGLPQMTAAGTEKKARRVERAGPMLKRNVANVRTLSKFDYQPDICKDWKQTGYCGYGDTCKFVHDRSNYKSGWQLEKEFNEEQKRREMAALTGAGVGKNAAAAPENKPDAALPFACLKCKGDFVKPVVTRCGHYFCETCALSTFRVTPNCSVCGEQTAGIFNRAAKLIAALAARSARAQQSVVDG